MGKAIRTGQGGLCKVKLDQAVKLHSSLQHVMTAVPGCSTSASGCAKHRRQSRSRGSRGHRHPAPAVPPFHSCSPSRSCSQKPLSEGRCIFTFVPIKKIKENSKIVMVLVWQTPHYFLIPCDIHPSARSQQWVCSLQPRVKNKPENSCLSQLLSGFSCAFHTLL